ncbi:tripartite tricarboxylate transporter TctB family protein [Microvirga antarctica]|uniref:tripartite tricarboxylate transporter TctB family protein n=1 Tax=Microvirga antarctica TaxID=2819233 RepID=UPI001B30897C|nr:tripartite tricarboxylate transporter TctB family protein [Microvirga antarctica]
MARGNIDDILGGLFFALVGIVGAILSSRYQIGTAAEMGPGYMPLGVFGILACIGTVIAVQGATASREPLEVFQIRPALLVILGTTAFALLLRTGGLFAASLVLVMIVSFADEDARFRESAIAGTMLAIFATLVFSVGLGVPLPIWPWSE